MDIADHLADIFQIAMLLSMVHILMLEGGITFVEFMVLTTLLLKRQDMLMLYFILIHNQTFAA